MKAMWTFTISALIGISMLGCKPIVNEFAFYPDNVNVIPANNLPNGIQEITINTDDNVELISLFLPSTESKKLLIYFHGNAGNIYHRIPSLLQIHNTGVSVIGVSYRGYGKSEGDPSEEGIYLDGEAIYQHAVERMGFSKENIILFGRSIGTAVAINIAQNKQLRGIILVTPLTSGSDLAKAIGLGAVASLAEGSFNNITKVENIKSPLLVIHGTSDRIIPYSMGREIFDRANVKKEFVKIDGANHNNLHDDYKQKYWPPILRFINNV